MIWNCCWRRGGRSVLSREEGRELAGRVRDGLPMRMRQRLRAIHVIARINEGITTVRIFTTPVSADDPEAYVFLSDEI